MANNLTNYLEQKLLDLIFNGQAFAALDSAWIALHTADPGEDATTGELSTSGTGYARVQVNKNAGAAPKWRLAISEVGGGFQVSNLNDIVFGPALIDWGTITHLSIWDAVTAGNPLFQGPLAASRVVQTDGTLTFTPDDLKNILR